MRVTFFSIYQMSQCCVINLLGCPLYEAEIHDPAGGRIRLARDGDADPERMAVQTAALVAGRDVRQAMGRLGHELFEDFHAGHCNGAGTVP